MKFEDLIDFIDNRMRMSHIYQPLLLRILVEAGGTATIRQLAHGFLAQDESQLRYYENRIKQMPVPVLKKRGVISKEGELVSLNCKKLTFEQKAQVVMSCEKRLQQFIIERGLDLWGYRLLDTDPIPGSLRYRVLKESGGRMCQLWCSPRKNAHWMWTTSFLNPRAVKMYAKTFKSFVPSAIRRRETRIALISVMICLLIRFPTVNFVTRISRGRIIEELDTVVAIKDGYPVTKGHLLVIPKRHAPEYFDLSDAERRDVDSLLKFLKQQMIKKGSIHHRL